MQNGLRVSGVHCMRWLGSPARERHERFLALLDPTGSQESANGSIDKVTIPGDRLDNEFMETLGITSLNDDT